MNDDINILDILAMPYKHFKHIYKSIKKYDSVPVGFSEVNYDNYLKLSPENRALIDAERKRYYGPYVNAKSSRVHPPYLGGRSYDAGQDHMDDFIRQIRAKERNERRIRKIYGQSTNRVGKLLSDILGIK